MWLPEPVNLAAAACAHGCARPPSPGWPRRGGRASRSAARHERSGRPGELRAAGRPSEHGAAAEGREGRCGWADGRESPGTVSSSLPFASQYPGALFVYWREGYRPQCGQPELCGNRSEPWREPCSPTDGSLCSCAGPRARGSSRGRRTKCAATASVDWGRSLDGRWFLEVGLYSLG
jgi:hypothetical protein